MRLIHSYRKYSVFIYVFKKAKTCACTVMANVLQNGCIDVSFYVTAILIVCTSETNSRYISSPQTHILLFIYSNLHHSLHPLIVADGVVGKTDRPVRLVYRISLVSEAGILYCYGSWCFNDLMIGGFVRFRPVEYTRLSCICLNSAKKFVFHVRVKGPSSILYLLRTFLTLNNYFLVLHHSHQSPCVKSDFLHVWYWFLQELCGSQWLTGVWLIHGRSWYTGKYVLWEKLTMWLLQQFCMSKRN